jgi:hypothetical protein
MNDRPEWQEMFNVFRETGCNVDFIKEQVFGKKTIPETLPSTPSLLEVLGNINIGNRLDGDLEDGEIRQQKQ